MKECSLCSEMKPSNQFKKDRRTPSGFGSWCLDCAQAKGRQYYAENKVRRLAMNREDYRRHSEDRKAKEKMRRVELRRRVLEHYGNRCACCGEDRQEFLCIDHINGGGNKHRREVAGGGGGSAFYLWIKRNEFPEGLRVLCFNCNHALVHYEICPHAPSEVSRLREATEQLSAKTALAIWRKLDALSREHLGYEFSLFAYAEALEQ